VGDDAVFQGILNEIRNVDHFMIWQKINWIEEVTLGCCEQKNGYTVMDAQDKDSEGEMRQMFRIIEQSENCPRICCAPCHDLDLTFMPMNRESGVGETYFHYDGVCPGGCFKENCCQKCYGCWACSEKYQKSGTVWPSRKQGVSYRLVEKACNGCTPEIVITEVSMDNGQIVGENPVAMIGGPACFGGWSEFCFDSHFFISSIDPKTLNPRGIPGDICRARKCKPETCADTCREMCTDADKFEVIFTPDFELNKDPGFKAAILSACFFLDYAFFEYDYPLCYHKDDACHFFCFDLYCCGCLCPCEICIPTKFN